MQSSILWKFQFLGTHSSPSVPTTERTQNCKPSCWHTPVTPRGCPGRSSALCSWHSPLSKAPPAAPCLFPAPLSSSTHRNPFGDETQGRSPLAKHKFLRRLGGRGMSPQEFQCLGTAGWTPCPAQDQPGTRLISRGNCVLSLQLESCWTRKKPDSS